MEIKGKVIQKFGIESGTNASGKQWKKQNILIETIETYPKKVYISFMGDKIDELSNVYPGAIVEVSVNVESREFNGKWYTNINGWKLKMETEEQQKKQQTPEPKFPEPFEDQGIDDMPF